MPKAAKKKPKKPAAKAVIVRKKPKPKPRRKPMATEKNDKEHVAPAPAPKEPLAGGIKGAQPEVNAALPPEAYMTEQEKAGQQAPVDDEAPKKKETK
jgi:hypothetical protein